MVAGECHTFLSDSALTAAFVLQAVSLKSYRPSVWRSLRQVRCVSSQISITRLIFSLGIGGILAGIGMELSIIMIWVGGRKSVGAYGQSLLDLLNKIDVGNIIPEGEMSEAQLTQNLFVTFI